MPELRIALFGGQIPLADPRLLPDYAAQIAINTKLWDGKLGAYRQPLTVVTPSKSGTKRSIYRFGQDVTDESQYWLHWTTDVDVAKSPIAGDTAEKTCWTGEAEPRITDSTLALTGGGTDYPIAWYKLGVPAPAATPSVVTSGSGTGVETDIVYVYTFVNSYGQEGPPSSPSSAVQWQPGKTNTLTGMSTSAGSGYNITAKRIYRTVTGSNSTDYRFVAEIAAATTSYADSKTADQLGESLPSTFWDGPPSDMFGLIVLPNGIMAGLSGNELLLSEPYMPHAWPDTYRLACEWKPVGLGQFGKNVVVLTKGLPYIATGTHPSQFSMDKIEVGQACVNKRSIASVPKAGVVYACPSGLAMVGPGGSDVVTKNLMDQDDWDALVPSSIEGYAYTNSRYFGFYDTGSVQQGFIFDPNSERAPLTFTDTYATAGYRDPIRDKLYLQIGGAIKRWDGGATKMTYQWKSRITVPGKPGNPGFGQVEADDYTSLTFKLYGDGSLKATKTVSSNQPFRLPDGYKAREFEVEISGTSRVRAVYLAETMAGLKRV